MVSPTFQQVVGIAVYVTFKHNVYKIRREHENVFHFVGHITKTNTADFSQDIFRAMQYLFSTAEFACKETLIFYMVRNLSV